MGCASARHASVRVYGCDSKRLMAGPIAPAEIEISTAALARVLKYEPGDLTISVAAGMCYAELERVLAANGQMLPFDPPFAEQATIGGLVAANTCGPRRRLYGAIRDFVIGMTFATLEGKLVATGGMVVKNVAGLDLSKLMIGSFGTLAAIASVNFKLAPLPPHTRTFLLRGASAEAIAARDRLLASVLQPAAVDLVVARDGAVLAVQAGGNPAVIERYTRELAGAEILEGAAEREFWTGVREFSPRFLKEHPAGAVVRVSCRLSEVGEAVASSGAECVVRAASGIVYAHFADAAAAAAWARARGGVVEYAPEERKPALDLWPSPPAELDLMRRVKNMFDPGNLLNSGRLYGRL